MKIANSGFTLIEVLVVVLIIGILASVAIPQYQSAVDKGRYSNLMSLTKSLANSQESFFMANGSYATSFDQLDIGVPATSVSGNTATFDWGQCVLVDQQEVQCSNYDTLKNEYIIHYEYDAGSDHGKTFCTAITTEADSRYDKVCSYIGTYKEQTTCIGGTCRVYEIDNF